MEIRFHRYKKGLRHLLLYTPRTGYVEVLELWFVTIIM